jgi:hypothetical protein
MQTVLREICIRRRRSSEIDQSKRNLRSAMTAFHDAFPATPGFKFAAPRRRMTAAFTSSSKALFP